MNWKFYCNSICCAYIFLSDYSLAYVVSDKTGKLWAVPLELSSIHSIYGVSDTVLEMLEDILGTIGNVLLNSLGHWTFSDAGGVFSFLLNLSHNQHYFFCAYKTVAWLHEHYMIQLTWWLQTIALIYTSAVRKLERN